MSLLRIILWSIIFYLVYRTAKNLIKLFFSSGSVKDENKIKRQKQTKYKIEKDDVIDAHFEDIDSTKSDKPKENS
ncbi:MAG: hypothetical protein AB1298_10390 [Bacteroidota bacterium]